MNNIEINKLNELEKRKNELEDFMHEKLMPILAYRDSFITNEGILAMKSIHKHFVNAYEERENIELEINNIISLLAKDCNHEFLIKVDHKYICPICKTIYHYENDLPDTYKYIATISENEIINTEINNIILKSNTKEEVIENLIDYFSELQFEDGISLERKKL